MSKGTAPAKKDPPKSSRGKPGRAGRDGPADRDDLVGPDPELLHDAAETFAMLASPVRLHLLWLLSRREYDVGSLAEAVDASDAAVSQHLAKLRLSDLVTARRAGKRQVYVVDDDHVSVLIEQALDHHAAKRR
jgi:DNA-binding transcriptional ArsR family regulator